MSAAKTAASRGRELAVFVRAHHLVVAIPAVHVVRLLLPNEVAVLRAGSPGLVEGAGGETFASWDLGALLGLEALDAAWVLLRAPRRGGRTVDLALRTGPCIVVDALPDEVPLTRGIYRSRPGAFSGAFAARGRHGGESFGLVLDLGRLFSESEIEACAPKDRRAGAGA